MVVCGERKRSEAKRSERNPTEKWRAEERVQREVPPLFDFLIRTIVPCSGIYSRSKSDEELSILFWDREKKEKRKRLFNVIEFLLYERNIQFFLRQWPHSQGASDSFVICLEVPYLVLIKQKKKNIYIYIYIHFTFSYSQKTKIKKGAKL